MTQPHFDTLKARVQPFAEHYGSLVAQYAANPKIKDAGLAARCRILAAAKIYDVYTYQEFDYMDSHVDTAMRKILGELT